VRLRPWGSTFVEEKRRPDALLLQPRGISNVKPETANAIQRTSRDGPALGPETAVIEATPWPKRST